MWGTTTMIGEGGGIKLDLGKNVRKSDRVTETS